MNEKNIKKFIENFEKLGAVNEVSKLLTIIEEKKENGQPPVITESELQTRIKDLVISTLHEIFSMSTEDKPKQSNEEDCNKCNETECPSHPTKMN